MLASAGRTLKRFRLIEEREPNFLASMLGASAVFVREQIDPGECFDLMLVEAKDGGYLLMGDAPKAVFVENRSDVEAWRQSRSPLTTAGRATP